MKFQNIFACFAISAIAGTVFTTSAFAAASDAKPLSYSEVKKILGQGGGNVKKTKAMLTGRNISIKVQGGADTVTVNDRDRVFFACKNLKSFKPGATLFATVVDYSETGGDSDPLILLDSCNLERAQPSALSPAGRR